MLSFDIKGALPYQHIREILIEKYKAIRFQQPVTDDQLEEQLQPATLDTRIFGPIHRVAHFKPPKKNETVAQVLRNASLYTIDSSVKDPHPIERNVKYVVELNETLALPPNIFAEADTRSTGGRNFFRCKLVTDNNPQYNHIPEGYEGRLYMEFSSLAFLQRLRAGDRIEQVRFYNGDARISDDELMGLHLTETIAYDKEGNPMPPKDLVENGLVLTADLSEEIVGYTPMANEIPVEYGKKASMPKEQYWTPLVRPKNGILTLWGQQMAILHTYELPCIPKTIAARMVQYDQSMTGDDKTNEAGYFDSGFGRGRDATIRGSTAVLEYIVSRQERTIEHRQRIGSLIPERVIEEPKKIYGDGNNYQGQRGATLGHQFC